MAPPVVTGGLPISLIAPIIIGTLGAMNAVKRICIDKRDRKCACVGNGPRVPIRYVAPSQSLIMAGTALCMLQIWFVG